ncbi:hypothetical protein [Paractinoplanes lichenicola]|uniref:Uncharacterized protein n=1 Tax=Paractinoplanes lichenicola TaxID=2802976 RepID=A0ABS1VUZ6_9ACTN|nr:hypothetical protein [Actinoplanes lichenicola]MBL7258291.1 hypothetical protein [Actinoplanes lichenicola]
MWFVERSRVDSPYGKLVFHHPGTTVLGWFQLAWHHDDPEALLGSDPYGFDSIFEAIAEHDLPCPRTLDELRDVLDEHLWIESDDPIRLDERGVRVRTNDDEADVAYYFLEDEAVAAHPDRLAYLVNDTWPLPADVGAAPGPPSVHLVRIAWQHLDHDGTNLDNHGVTVFPGVTLPGFADHLRGRAAGGRFDADLLRALVGPGEDGLEPAMSRYVALGGYDLSNVGTWTAPSHEQILRSIRPSPSSRLAMSGHVVQAARYIDDFWGYEQLFLFDSLWAAAHPDLAGSLLRYGSHWDPFDGLRPPP